MHFLGQARLLGEALNSGLVLPGSGVVKAPEMARRTEPRSWRLHPTPSSSGCGPGVKASAKEDARRWWPRGRASALCPVLRGGPGCS